MEKKILEVLQSFHCDGLFVNPSIPQKKADNAFACYGMPASVEVFAIVDSTVFGSAKNGLAFTSEGLFWKNDWTITSAKNQMSWEEFKNNAQERDTKGFDLLLGNGCVFGMAGSSMKPKVLLQLMEELTQQIQELIKPTESEESIAVVQPVVIQDLNVSEDVPVSHNHSVSVAAKQHNPEPSRKPVFEGSYQQEHLHVVNAVAKRHRLSQQIYIAPAIKVYKVKKVIDISAGQIKPYDILLIADNTFLGTANDFLVVTAHAVWGKGTLRKLENFLISDIRSIRCEQKKLYINDYDFLFLDQFSDNEVLILTNMLKELVVALGKLRGVSTTAGQQKLPSILDKVLSNIYDSVIDDVVTTLQMRGHSQSKQLVAALTECCFGAFYVVDSHLEYRSQDLSELLGQYLLAQTLSSALALRSSDELWNRIELQATYILVQSQLIARVFHELELKNIVMRTNQNTYLQILKSVITGPTLEQGLKVIEQDLGHVTQATEQAISSSFDSVEEIQELFSECFN
jgi:hypothetical protein